MKLRLISLCALAAVVIAAACSDPVALKATFSTTRDTVGLYALSGTAPTLPSGLNVLARQPVRIDGFAAFDIAFDIISQQQVILYPVKLIVSAPGGVRQVGLLKVTGAFEEVLKAPASGYQADSAVVLTPGQVVVIQTAQNSGGGTCAFSFSPNVFAKLAVTSIDLVNRLVRIALVVDPNCGFRSFEPGIPTS